ncbi:MAG: ferredoxin subunit of nitrite reductase and ring-hydroxylating dioxygenase [Verrucomicrobiaceae bacterium]|nr:ferredoxin subunit of nitrite reductase and ring-hydroxylating dioxygenase [Verrucomicrobiaceae bacterium]
MRFYQLEKFINLHDGYRRVFKIDEHQLLLLQHDGERHLFEAQCPHRGHSLETAHIENNCLRCPLHGYQFQLNGGHVRVVSEEPCRPLRCYELVYRDKDLGVLL